MKLAIKTVGAFINITAPLFPIWNANYSFNLLCKVKRVGITQKGSAFFKQGKTQFLEVNGHSAALHSWGEGAKSVLFLHGWLSNSQRWRKFVEQLDLNEYTVYALDAPGHGMAKGHHLNVEIYRQAFMKTYEIAGPLDTLVCHSLGSLVGAYAFLYRPSIVVKKFVITGAPSGMDAIFAYFKELLSLSQKAIDNLDVKINSVLQLPHREIHMKHFFRKVEVPVLVVHETADRITPVDPIKKAAANHNKIETYFTNGNDHNLKTQDVIEQVIQFITK